MTQLDLSLGALKVGVIRADDTVVVDQFVRVWQQRQDLAGLWTRTDEVVRGNTDNTGAVSFGLTPGYYIVETDLPGYNWGDAKDSDGKVSVPIKPGEETTVIISLGQVLVGLLDADGQPQVDEFVRLFTQKTDDADEPVIDQEVARGNTDNTGAISFHVTPGKYALQVDDRVTYDIVVEAGRVTDTDGTQFRVQ